MNFKAVLALPKTARSAQTHKSISFIVIVWSTLYVYLWNVSDFYQWHKGNRNTLRVKTVSVCIRYLKLRTAGIMSFPLDRPNTKFAGFFISSKWIFVWKSKYTKKSQNNYRISSYSFRPRIVSAHLCTVTFGLMYCDLWISKFKKE